MTRVLFSAGLEEENSFAGSRQNKMGKKLIGGERESERKKEERLELSVSHVVKEPQHFQAFHSHIRLFPEPAPFPQSLSYSHSRISSFSLFQATTPLCLQSLEPFLCCVPSKSYQEQLSRPISLFLLEASTQMGLPVLSQH